MMKTKSRHLTAVYMAGLFTLAFCSCSYKQNQNLFQNQSQVQDTSFKETGIVDYKIRSQDMLQIRNLQNVKFVLDDVPGSSTSQSSVSLQPQSYQVQDDGTVALPVIGNVKVTGLTRAEAAKKITDLYQQSLLKDPIIELKITSLKVTLLGEVKAPGNYPLVDDRTNLIDLIGQAGGLTEKADEKQIKIIRGDRKNPKVIEFDLSDIRTVSNPAIILQSQDIIYISQNKHAIRTEKFQNFSTLAQPGLTLLNTALLIFTLAKK